MATALDGLGRQIASIEPATASAAVADVRQDITPKLAKLVVGQQLRGEIISKLTDGSFTVKVAGFTAKMLLPKEFSQGDTVPLRLISVQPRPTFLLDQEESGTKAPASRLPSVDGEDLASTSLRRSSQAEIARDESIPRTASKAAESDVVLHLSDENHLKSSPAATAQKQVTQQTEPGGLARNYATESAPTSTAQSIQKVVPGEIEAEPSKLPDGTPTSAPTVLSNAARVISQVLSSYASDSQTSTIQASKPVVEHASQLQQTTELSHHLQKQIDHSGLFYESHLAQWVDGKLSLQSLNQEPQQQLPSFPDQLNNVVNSTPITPDTTNINQLMNSQLQLLDQQKLVWHGELYPGQKMEWEIERGKSGQGSVEMGEQAVWYSSVRFELPHLGAIEVKLNLSGHQLGLTMTAQDNETISLIKSKVPLLSDNLQSNGTDLTSFNAKLNEQT